MDHLPLGSSGHCSYVKEASKLTLGQPTIVYTPHQVQAVLETKGDRWMTGGRITQYQALVLDTPEIKLRVCQTLKREGNGTPLQYSCLENPMDGGAW